MTEAQGTPIWTIRLIGSPFRPEQLGPIEFTHEGTMQEAWQLGLMMGRLQQATRVRVGLLSRKAPTQEKPDFDSVLSGPVDIVDAA